MKLYFLVLLIAQSPTEYYYVKIPFSYIDKPITCEEAFENHVKVIPNPNYKEDNGEIWVLLIYKDKYYVFGHYCTSIFGKYYSGYEEKLNWELNQ